MAIPPSEPVLATDTELRAQVKATYERARRLVFDLPVRPTQAHLSSEQIGALADFAEAEAALREFPTGAMPA